MPHRAARKALLLSVRAVVFPPHVRLAGLNGTKVLQCKDINDIVLGVLALPKGNPLADVSVTLTDKSAPWV